MRSRDLATGKSRCSWYGLKADLNAYLASLGSNAPMKTLKDIIDFNEKHADRELQVFARNDLFKPREQRLTDAKYVEALIVMLARTQGIDAVMTKSNPLR